ncbi:MAG TPA: hypothetical protein VMG98_13915 [Verrucomicrobiae bacterium]|nr:hypothetical protein [Verrucomicrobiae bacterium]
MTRPHEDLRHHTPVDHRPGGPAIQFADGAWCVIDILHVKSERAPAVVSAYETLVEQARTSAAKAGNAVILRSINDRRVVAILEVGGHGALAHIQASWDDHHLLAEHRTSAESRGLALYHVVSTTGDCALDPASRSVYAFEHFPSAPQSVQQLIDRSAAAQGFLGAQLFATDDGTKSFAIYHFEHREEIEALRPNALAAHPVKTF